jgi:hypothetical protein
MTPDAALDPTATQILPFHPTDWQLVVKSAFPDVLPIQFADPSALYASRFEAALDPATHRDPFQPIAKQAPFPNGLPVTFAHTSPSAL